MALSLYHIKIRFVCYGAFFFILRTIQAQTPYFQQEVNYKMSVRLNDQNHSLSGTENIQYINRSPQALEFIYIHLWANAYKNNRTAFCKQLVSHGRDDLFYAGDADRGYIDSLNFTASGQCLKMVPDENNPDIARLLLPSPLKPNDTLNMSTPFYVKIPDARFSRLGHTGQAYFITQWYPKPAVYDNEGWHAMPYLDQGEFYSEFGSFDVSITLPDNYVLAATGDRIDAAEEEDFLNRRVAQTMKAIENNSRIKDGMSFPPSSTKFKTIRFRQYRVHDFAWFADKRFYALHDQIQLPESHRTVDTWTFFTDKNFHLWKESIKYVNAATDFYSRLVGDYPYKHVTAVDGTIMAGGGMEYPEITVIGDMGNAFDLDVTIAHEVGHNWFYGILGSNERRYPFMDEGINSFYEKRYIRQYYPNVKLSHYIDRDSNFKFLRLNKVPVWKEMELMYFLSHASNVDQAINLSADAYSMFNYGSIVYSKTPLAFDYLMTYMTEANFDAAMQQYYTKYKFTHPSPNNLMEELSQDGRFNLEWFSTHLLGSTNAFDYKLKRVRGSETEGYRLLLKNKKGLLVPLNVTAYAKGKKVGDMWLDGFTKKREVIFPPGEVDYFKIDGEDKLIESNKRNNYSRTKGMFRHAKGLQLTFLTAYPDATKNQIHYLPMAGSNIYDGMELGLAIHNYGFYRKKFEYAVAPMYGFGSKQVVGMADINYNFFPKKFMRQITVGTNFKRFNYDRYQPSKAGITAKDQLFAYQKIRNYVQFDFKKEANSPVNHLLRIENNLVIREQSNNRFQFDGSGVSSYTLAKSNSQILVNQVYYELRNKRHFDPYVWQVDVQQAATVSKISSQLSYNIDISRHKQLNCKLFFGGFLSGSTINRSMYAFRPSGYNGYDDYLFAYQYLGRNESSGFAFSQFTEKDGNLKVWTPLGRSTTWMASLQLKSPAIGKLPLKIFADAMACDGQFLYRDKLMWDAGFNIPLVNQIVDIYIPLLYNKDIQNTMTLHNIGFFNRIRFTVNIHKLEARNIIQSNLF
jgi:hypothetical protein